MSRNRLVICPHVQQLPRVTRIGSLPSKKPADPRRALEETPAEAPENALSGKFLGEPRGGLCPSDGDPPELSDHDHDKGRDIFFCAGISQVPLCISSTLINLDTAAVFLTLRKGQPLERGACCGTYAKLQGL